ncbi:MAG: PilZ domain-containing protein [Bdellovibrionaceae bacterium]|nr:PilZ domain-containing protein [Pseudobdellovibrionaceae bacterium]
MKRQPQRFQVNIPARFRPAGTSTEWLEGRLLNLSEGGLCLESQGQTLLPGEILEIVIDTIDGKGIPRKRFIRAKIVWRKDGRTGVQFMRSHLLPPLKGQSSSKSKDARTPSAPKLSVARKLPDSATGDDGSDNEGDDE